MTTLTPLAQELSIDKRADKPPKEAPYPTLVGTAITGQSASPPTTLARALAAKPKIMLMDEPFGALDEITRKMMQKELLALHKKLGLTVVFITHDIREAMKLGDRVLVMDQGRAIQLDKPEVILEHPANAFVQELISD